MKDEFNPIPIVSKPSGNIDKGSLLSWLDDLNPALLEQPSKIQNVRCNVENEDGYFVVTPYLTPKKRKYLSVKVIWDLEVDQEPIEVWSTLYTTILHPQDEDNLKQLVMAKAQVLMLTNAYCEHIKAIVDSTHRYHDLVVQDRYMFQMMKHFFVDATPTGRIRRFVVITREGDQLEASDKVAKYFNVSQVNQFESMTLIKNGFPDLLHQAFTEESSGHLNRNLVEYYTWCGKRYCLTFEEAYTKLIDILADDHVQRSLTDLKKMEQGIHSVPISVTNIRKKYDNIITFLHRDTEVAKREFLIMEECHQHIRELIDKFDSWREHPELSLSRTSLLERKIEELSRGLKQKRLLISELRSRFDDIEYWAGWFKKQFPTLFSILDKDQD